MSILSEWAKMIGKGILVVFLGAALAGTAIAASHQDVLKEDFSFVPDSGLSGEVSGKAGQGWTQPEPGLFIDHPVSLSSVRKGVISFDIQRLASGEAGHEDTVFELLGPEGDKDSDKKKLSERILMLRVKWQSTFDPSRSTIFFMGPGYAANSLGLWDREILLDVQPAVGQWVHVDLVWDDDTRVYGLYLDGRAQDIHQGKLDRQAGMVIEDTRIVRNRKFRALGLPEPYKSKPFAYFLEQVDRLQVGYLNRIVDDPEVLPQLAIMKSAVVDNLAIRSGDVAAIRSVTHDAFDQAGYSGQLVVGDTVTVTLTGDPGGTAAFDIIHPGTSSAGKTTSDKIMVAGVPMTEDPDNPGTYTGTYTIGWGNYYEDGLVVGYLARLGFNAEPMAAAKSVDVDGRVHLAVNTSNDLVPADREARSGLTIVAADANGKAVKDHELKFTLSTTDEYTGTVGGGNFEDQVGGEIDVDWGGVTDSFGEVTAQYISGFAAKTILVSAKDMVSGDVGVGFVRSFIDGTVDIVVTEPKVTALSVSGTMDVSLSRDWLTADGQSRSRITAVVKDADGDALSGHSVQFTLLGDNGSVRVVQGKTDSRGRAFADYIAGTLMGQVQVEVRDMTSGMVAIVGIELRPDAPAVIELAADPAEVVTGGETTVTAKVTDANDNPNAAVDVLYDVVAGEGTVGAASVATDDDGVASVTFTAGDAPGLVTVSGTVISREPTAEEFSAAKGAVFLFGLEEDPGRLDVLEWMVEPGDEVTEGQVLVALEDRSDTVYTVVAPRDGTVATFVTEERDRVEYGDTLGYILELAE